MINVLFKLSVIAFVLTAMGSCAVVQVQMQYPTTWYSLNTTEDGRSKGCDPFVIPVTQLPNTPKLPRISEDVITSPHVKDKDALIDIALTHIEKMESHLIERDRIMQEAYLKHVNSCQE